MSSLVLNEVKDRPLWGHLIVFATGTAQPTPVLERHPAKYIESGSAAALEAAEVFSERNAEHTRQATFPIVPLVREVTADVRRKLLLEDIEKQPPHLNECNVIEERSNRILPLVWALPV